MSTTAEKLLTIEEYAKLPDLDYPNELVRGRIVRMNPPSSRHGQVCNSAAFLLTAFAREHDLGHVLSNDSGVITEREPDTLRGADVAFYRYDRVPKGPLGEGYLEVAPDVVIEVLSTFDRWPDVLAKIAEYLDAGVGVVCILNPRKLSAQVYRSNGDIEILDGDRTLRLPELSDAFAEPVSRFFE